MSYAIASGHNVPLASLDDIAQVMLPYTRRPLLYPKTQPVDLYPIRKVAVSNLERGGGTVAHLWTWAALPVEALDKIIDDYAAAGYSAEVTIYTRLHVSNTFVRYNAYLADPQPGVDFTYSQAGVFDVRLRFLKLEVAS